MDQIDREHLEQVAESRGLQLIFVRLAADANGKAARLRCREVDPAETSYLRGYLDAIDTVLRIPGVLVAEARKTSK